MYNPSEQEIYDEQKKRQQPATDQSAYTYVDDGNGNIVPGPGVGITPQTQQPAATEQPVVTQPATETPYEVPFAVDKANNYPSSGQQTVTPVVNTEEQQTATETPETEQTVTEQPDTGTAGSSKYKYDWASGMTFDDAFKQNKHTAREIMLDQDRWARENGKPIDYLSWATLDNKYDLNKTKEQSEADEEKAKRKAKWDAIGTFISHLGNFIGAAAGGGSVKLPDPVQLTERQRKIQENTEALRKSDRESLYQKILKHNADQRSAELAKAREANEKRKLDRLDEDQRLKVRRQDWLEKYQQGILDDKAERRRIDEEYRLGRINDAERRTAIAELNAITSRMRENRQAAGTTVEVHKADGSVETKVTTPNAKGSGKGKSKSAFGSRSSGKSAFGKR